MRPALGVDVAVLQQNKVLLIKRADMPVWALPGGAVDEGESILQAATRETLEETGLIVQLDRAIGFYSRPQWAEGSHALLYTVHPVGGQLFTSTNETVDARYFDRSDLPADLLWWFRQRIDDLFDAPGFVVRAQNATLPCGITSRREFYEGLQNGSLDMRNVVEQLCSVPEAEQTSDDLV